MPWRSVGEFEMALKIPPVAACCSRDSASSPLANESSLVSSSILRSAEARSSVGEVVMNVSWRRQVPNWGVDQMLRDTVARWNVHARPLRGPHNAGIGHAG